jgi:hypothetical protein
MKVSFQTDRLLQLKQSKWLPWYWQLPLWPIVLLMFLMSMVGQESKLTCRKAEGKCQLEMKGLSTKESKTINLNNIQKIDLVATENEDTSSLAQLVIVGKDGSQTKVGNTGSFEKLDEIAAKLSWFLESSTAQFIELDDSNIWLMRFFGLTAGTACFWFFWRGGSRVVTFDRDRQLCTIESRKIWQKKVTEYPIAKIAGVDIVDSFKPVGYNMALQNRSGPAVVLNDKVLPVSKAAQAEQTVAQIRSFLNLQVPDPAPQDAEE